MPQKSTFRPGPMTSRSVLARAASSCLGVGLSWPDEVATGLLVRLELDEAFLLGIFQEVGKGAEPVVRLVEAGFAPLESLLDHRAPDVLAGAALSDERVERLDQEIEGFLLLVLVLARGRRFAPLLRRPALLLVGAHQIVVVDELVAVADQQIRARVLHPDADHGLRVLAQLGDERREVRVAADDDEGI